MYDESIIKSTFAENGPIASQFKNYSVRNQQVKLSEAIYDAYENCTNLLAEAPTGIGKSMAGLVAALRQSGTVLIATATKALQEQYFNKDLPFMKKVFGDAFTYAMLKGRNNYLCLKRFQEFKFNPPKSLWMKDFGQTVKQQIQAVDEWLKTSTYGDLDSLGFNLSPEIRNAICSSSDDCDGKKECLFAKSGQCPYYANKTKAESSKVVLVNIDLLCTDLIMRNMYHASVLPKCDSIIIDEAHELENIFSKYIGFSLSENAFRFLHGAIINFIKKIPNECSVDKNSKEYSGYLTSVDFDLLDINGLAAQLFDNFNYEHDKVTSIRIFSNDVSEDIIELIKKIVDNLYYVRERLNYYNRYFVEKTKNKCESVKSQIDSIVDRLLNIADIQKRIDDFVYWIEFNNRDRPVINCSPIDISMYLKKWLFDRKLPSELSLGDVRSIVLMSATLTTNKSFEFMKSRMGVCTYYPSDNSLEQTKELLLHSEFDFKHNCLLYLPRGLSDPSGVSKTRDVFTSQLVMNIERLAKVSQGRMLCLFTSNAELQKVYNQLKGKLPYKMFSQLEYPKRELIEMFKNDINSILFATSSFWTGVSFEGETCSVVVIDRIPFPVPTDPIIEARIDKLKKERKDWFGKYYLPMAMLTIQQGFGRLIRTNTDMGCVMICDRRLVTKPYGNKIVQSLPHSLRTSDFEKVELFFDICEKKRKIFKKGCVLK